MAAVRYRPGLSETRRIPCRRYRQGMQAGLTAALQKLPSVMMVHDLHVWTTDGVEALATAHLVVAEHDYQILDQAQATLREFGIEHSTIQLEQEDHIQHEDFCD